MAIVSFGKVLEAFQIVSGAAPSEAEAYLDIETGATYWHSELFDDCDPLPPDLEESEKYVAIPHKNDLGLGKPLALDFADLYMTEVFETVRESFCHRGAYSRFKDLLARRGQLEQWYEFEAAAQKDALRKWCEVKGIELDG